MLVLLRAIIWATLSVGFLLVFVPGRILTRAGIVRPPSIGGAQFGGLVLLTLGGMLALWCILTFVVIGKGTPAPFDPPRQLVVRGPYRFVRNPMYIGAGSALLGAAIFYGSVAIALYVLALWAAVHLLVVFYEEPTLHRTFGAPYDEYRRAVHRWIPTWRS
jgi:protein-S-isoprenylcysteine O-methyltransferase Ste14